MQYFTEQAPSHREALELVRAKYGEAAQILSHRSIRMGGFMGLFAREGVEVTGYLRPETKASKPPPQDLEEEKRKILSLTGALTGSQARADQALQQVLTEIQGLRERLDQRPAAAEADDHETLMRMDALLALNDFSEPFRRETLARLRRDFSIEGLENAEEVEDAVLEWIGDSIQVWKESEAKRPRILALVGPTGVGKTTTIAKLAAIYAVGMGSERPRSVRMITIDNYRIGARQQIETYGNIMGVPVSCVETADDLRKTIAFHSDADLILVDTVGKSPRDAVKLAEMQRILAACGTGAETHLALAATTKASDMVQALRQFEPFDYKAVILTKVDETNRLGNAISALAERRKSLSYITTGQRVPQDIERARVTRLLMNLEGFRVDRTRFEERYSEVSEEERAPQETQRRRSPRGYGEHQSTPLAERQLGADRS
ncbi:MAG TPA: flagellar biosynthesis protein FlhF [Rectinemataceae bacterium]|nr:flagellar biosynthesis protein FlhF [Rectinemataceae bacterium]